jgi:hypothetical protein
MAASESSGERFDCGLLSSYADLINELNALDVLDV